MAALYDFARQLGFTEHGVEFNSTMSWAVTNSYSTTPMIRYINNVFRHDKSNIAQKRYIRRQALGVVRAARQHTNNSSLSKRRWAAFCIRHAERHLRESWRHTR